MSKFSCGWNFCKRDTFHGHKTFRDECATQCYWSYKLYVLVSKRPIPPLLGSFATKYSLHPTRRRDKFVTPIR